MTMRIAVLLGMLAAVAGEASPLERGQPAPKADSAMRGLRDMALSVDAAELKMKPSKERPHVWGVLMELGLEQGVATMVAFADGTVSLYFSGGGGIIGAGAQKPVRQAAEGFLNAAETHLAHFKPTDATPPPDPGRVRFYVRTFKGTLLGEAGHEELEGGGHALSPVYLAGGNLLSALREADEAR